MSEIKLIINGTEYEMLNCEVYEPNYAVPILYREGVKYLGKEIKKEKDIPKPDWKVEEVVAAKETFWLLDGMYRINVGGGGHSLMYLMDYWNGVITVVRRLSDNQLFKIGDYFNYHLREVQSPIKEFIIDGNSMKVRVDEVLAPLKIEFISIANKPKEPLFTKQHILELLEKHLNG